MVSWPFAPARTASPFLSAQPSFVVATQVVTTGYSRCASWAYENQGGNWNVPWL
jgi:hypothetical protein